MRDAVIVGYHELKPLRHSRRTIYELATEAVSGALNSSGISRDEVDGLAVASAYSAVGEPFWSNRICDALGLSPRWTQTTDLGGASPIGSVARAASMIREGWCSVVVVLGVDAPTTHSEVSFGGYRKEFEAPYGPFGPLGLFALLQNRYAACYAMPAEALAKIAMMQRHSATLNPNALFKSPLTISEYMNSPMISDPIRRLDSVANCDGGGAIVLTTAQRAATLSQKMVRVAAYSEITNYQGTTYADATETGFRVAGPEALRRAGLRIELIDQFHPYDDFTSAVFMQFGELGFCSPSDAHRFVQQTDFSHSGTLPLNTGGGQLSCGQPGLAGGVVNLLEAIRQLRIEADGRQISNPRNALITGMGSMQYVRNWGTSAVLILEA
jgi:acetyl-CoA acetyltransferase